MSLFVSFDNTFCNNQECRLKNNCKRNLKHYQNFNNERLSMIDAENECELFVPIQDKFHQLIRKIKEYYKKDDIRCGQATFLALFEIDKNLYKELMITEFDCFYSNSVSNVKITLDFIKKYYRGNKTVAEN